MTNEDVVHGYGGPPHGSVVAVLSGARYAVRPALGSEPVTKLSMQKVLVSEARCSLRYARVGGG